MSGIDPVRLSEWYPAHAPALLLYARQWHDRATSEDLVQDAFVSLMSLERAPDDVRPWLFRTVRNAAVDRARARRRTHDHAPAVGRRASSLFERRAGDLVDADAVTVALEAMPIDEREVVVLRIWGGLTLAQVAAIVHAPIATVFRRYRRGLDAARAELALSQEDAPCRTSTTDSTPSNARSNRPCEG